MSKHFRRVAMTAGCLVAISFTETGFASAQAQPETSASSLSIEQVAKAMNHLTVDARSGRYVFDSAGAVHEGITLSEATKSTDLFESLTPQEVTELNNQIGAPTTGAFTAGITPYAGNKAHCDEQYKRDGDRCNRVRGGKAKALCWAAAAARYANCRR